MIVNIRLSRIGKIVRSIQKKEDQEEDLLFTSLTCKKKSKKRLNQMLRYAYIYIYMFVCLCVPVKVKTKKEEERHNH